MFEFSFRGGVWKETIHLNEKFLLFFLVGEQEMPFYQMLREGFANRVEDGKDKFTTSHQICKLFVSRQGFGIAKQYHSFYLKLDGNLPTLQIFSFSGESTGCYFKGKSRIMERKEVLEALPEGIESRYFYTRQEVLATNLMNKMVQVDRSEMKSGVRYINITKQKGGR